MCQISNYQFYFVILNIFRSCINASKKTYVTDRTNDIYNYFFIDELKNNTISFNFFDNSQLDGLLDSINYVPPGTLRFPIGDEFLNNDVEELQKRARNEGMEVMKKIFYVTILSH